MERYAWIGKIREGQIPLYEKRHKEIWPEMIKALKEAGICNYSIWRTEYTVFGYYECEKGIDYAVKIQKENPVVAKWEKSMKDIMDMNFDSDTDFQPKLSEVFYMK